MQINSIIDIVDGQLLNSPSISFIYNIKNNAKRIIEGDLFISSKTEDINLAIQNGAFAIIVEENMPIIDNEIAWIKVKSIEDALIRLFRFKLAAVDLKVFHCDVITFDLLNLYKSANKNIKFIEHDLEKSVKIIEELHADDILFSTNKTDLDKIYPENSNFNNEYSIDNLIEHSLFETTFSCNEKFFSKLKLPSLYIQQFLDIHNFFGDDIDESKLKKFNHLKPIFIDKFASVLEFGKSNKFIISQKNYTLVEDEINYLATRYKYAKTIYISKEKFEDFDHKIHVLPSLNELKDFLKEEDFNCVYMMGYEYNEIEYILSQNTHYQSLL